MAGNCLALWLLAMLTSRSLRDTILIGLRRVPARGMLNADRDLEAIQAESTLTFCLHLTIITTMSDIYSHTVRQQLIRDLQMTEI